MTLDDPPARARALAPLIEAHAEEAERTRRLPEPVLEALFRAGLFRLLLPRSLGGAEVGPPVFLRTVEALASADASTAWVMCQASGCSMFGAYLEPGAAREVFADDPRALLAWGAGPAGHAVAADGGYRVSGTWAFASGGRHATWLGGHCQVHEADGTPRLRADGQPEVRTVVVPASQATLRDVWRVVGLRATGSDSYTLDDVFVPARRVAGRDDPADRREAGALYLFPTGSLYASGFAGVALGIARSLLDAFVALARDKVPRGLDRPLRESPVVQSRLAQTEARLGAARSFLGKTLEEVWAAVLDSGRLVVDQRVRIRLAATHAIHEAVSVADFAYHGAGATAIFEGGPFERRFRDIHAVSQQVQGRHTHYETVGRALLGLDAASPFV